MGSLAAGTPQEEVSSRGGTQAHRRAGRMRTEEAAAAIRTGTDDAAMAPMLRRLLRSACEVIGAERGFFIVARGEVYDVASAHNIRPADVVDMALNGAALPLAAALREKILAAGDVAGTPLPMHDGFFEANSPAVLCVPLELGVRESGALCLLRTRQPRRISDLDIEIIQAFAEQAALALAAASHNRALTRLHASLNSLAPAWA